MRSDIKKLLQEMTLEEKAGMCSGKNYWETKPVPRLDVPSVSMSDGPHGLRRENNADESVAMKQSFPATCFPTASATACTWDRDLVYAMGKAIAEEAKDQGVSTVLGPGVNIKRSPLCGRNFEYFSEDPLLAGKLAVSYINGAQDIGIGTSLKHYACNNQEYLRMTISSTVDERTYREIYMRAFEIAVKEAQPRTVMCSYNRINGVYSSDNKALLTDVLRDEWGFKGLVVSDWGAMNDRVQGIKAGMDLEMPYGAGYSDKEIVKAVKDGRLTMEELDTVVERVLGFVDAGVQGADPAYVADYDAHHALARRIAGEAQVLLKNDDAILPLSADQRWTVIGELAHTYRHQGSGSSHINCKKLVNMLQAMEDAGIEYDFAEGYSLSDNGVDQAKLQQAVELAKGKQNVILVVGLTDSYESEGYDRSRFDIPQGHIDLVNEVSKVASNVILVLVGGSPFAMEWESKAKAILLAYLSGEAGAEAVVDILSGKVNPSGKLAETWPYSNTDNLADKYFGQGPTTVEYRESIYVGYRYYDAADKAVRYPFGYGMSYTTFAYSDMQLSAERIREGEGLSVKVTVTNTGDRDGKEIVQVYCSDVESTAFMPKRQLAGFCKVDLKAGESKTIDVELDMHSFGFFNTTSGKWQIESGDFVVSVGSDSRNIQAETKVYIESECTDAIPDLRGSAPEYYNIQGVQDIYDGSFEALYGRKLPVNHVPEKGDFTESSTLQDIGGTFVGKIILKVVPAVLQSQIKSADETTILMLNSGAKEFCMRSLAGTTNGIITPGTIKALIYMANGKGLRGAGLLFVNLFAILVNFIKLTSANKKIAKIARAEEEARLAKKAELNKSAAT